jgi:hypothetical protein
VLSFSDAKNKARRNHHEVGYELFHYFLKGFNVLKSKICCTQSFYYHLYLYARRVNVRTT